MPTDRVLIEIITAANMAGVEQAKAGFLSMTPATLALAAVLGAAIAVGKAALDNYKLQEDAVLELAQAVGVYNDQAGKAIPITEAQSAAIEKATDAASSAQDSLEITTNALTLAQLGYSDAVKKHGPHSEEARKAMLHLDDANIRMKQAVNANADAQAELTGAQAAAALVTRGAAIDLKKLNAEFDAWLQNNKRYVPDQYDAQTALASFVRAGSDATQSMRMLNDALDLSAIKHESVSDAAKTLILAEAGNSKGLRDLGITTAEFNDIMKSTLSDADKHAALLALVETKTAKGRDTTDSLTQSQRKLNTDWQTFTATIGPGVTTVLDGVAQAADAAALAITQATNALVAFGNDPASLAGLQNLIMLLTGANTGTDAMRRKAEQAAIDARIAAQGALTGPIPELRDTTSADVAERQRVIAANAKIAAAVAARQAASGTGLQSFDSGGTVQGDHAGEQVLVQAKVGEHFSMGEGKGGGDIHIHVNVDGLHAGDGPYWDHVANQIAQRLAYVTGR